MKEPLTPLLTFSDILEMECSAENKREDFILFRVTQLLQEFEPLEMEVGLDRVPTRLSSSELEAGRRQEDEENLQNLVDEVLNNEVDFIVGNSDLS